MRAKFATIGSARCPGGRIVARNQTRGAMTVLAPRSAEPGSPPTERTVGDDGVSARAHQFEIALGRLAVPADELRAPPIALSRAQFGSSENTKNCTAAPTFSRTMATASA